MTSSTKYGKICLSRKIGINILGKKILSQSFNGNKEDLVNNRYLGKDKKAVESFARKYVIIERNDIEEITKLTPNEAECAKRLKYRGYLVLRPSPA